MGETRQFCRLQDKGPNLLRAALSQLNLSVLAYRRILMLARKTADLAEALQYRPKVMMG